MTIFQLFSIETRKIKSRRWLTRWQFLWN